MMEENLDEMLDFNYHNMNAAWNSEEIMRWKPSSSSTSSSAAAPAAAANSNFISFQSNSEAEIYRSNDVVIDDDVINFFPSLDDSHKHKAAKSKTPLEAQNHVMAERKRRQNLRQLFISLSKVVPGLRKLDKATILEDAIDYMKGLEERVRVLEEGEEMLMVKEENNSNDNRLQNKGKSKEEYSSEMGEIEAKISGKEVLIKILCEKEKKMMMMWKIPMEMGKLGLNVVELSVMPFGEAALHITILAQMQGEFRGNVKDIVDLLHTVLPNARSVVDQKPLLI